MIKLQEVTRDNLERLWKMQILAFEDLLARYRDFDMSPGAESFETVLAKFEQPWTKYFFILCDDQTVGGVRVVDKADGAKSVFPPSGLCRIIEARAMRSRQSGCWRVYTARTIGPWIPYGRRRAVFIYMRSLDMSKQGGSTI